MRPVHKAFAPSPPTVGPTGPRARPRPVADQMLTFAQLAAEEIMNSIDDFDDNAQLLLTAGELARKRLAELGKE